jgi:hypothetical protein
MLPPLQFLVGLDRVFQGEADGPTALAGQALSADNLGRARR